VVRRLDYREAAPAAATDYMYLDSAGNVTEKSLVGHLASGVPGSVAGLYAAWKRLGSLPWPVLLAPAIRLANGHVVDSARSRDITTDRGRLAQFPASRAQFLPNDSAPASGKLWQQPDLARTLQLISDSGPDVFYRGQIADLIVAEMQRGRGLITRNDLRAYRAKWRTPVELTYRGFVQMPIERLLSKSYGASLRSEIDLQHATPTPPSVTTGGGVHTTHYSIVDAKGNAASVTTTLNGGFGSGVTVTGAGFLLNNEMDDFASAPGKPNMYGLVQGEANAIAPGKRMLSAMTPSIVLDRDGKLLMVVGTPGGPTIITTVAQVILNVLDQRMSLADAVA